VAVFKRLSSSGSSVSEDDFTGMFNRRYTCIKTVAVTKAFAVDEDVVCKLEPDADVELMGESKEDEAGLVRSECSVNGKKGWVTLRQSKGPSFLALASPFKTYTKNMDKAVADATAAVSKVSGSLSSKLKQGGEAKEGSSLKQAREEMTKLQEPVTVARKMMEELRTKVGKAKGDFVSKERAEANAHIDARNAKEAAAFVEAPKAKMDAVEADAKSAEEAAAPMAALSADEAANFATPATLLEQLEKLDASFKEHATAARDAIKEQIKAAQEVKPPTGGTQEAAKQLKSMTLKVDECGRKVSKALAMVRTKCKGLVTAKLEPVAEGIRKHAQKKKLSIEKLYESLMSGDKMPEKAFCKMVTSLEGLEIQPEHAQLICRKLEVGGVSRDAFMKYVVLYYKVVKGIAFTDALDISATKTLRKADEGEVIEVLEGPALDEGSQMTRVRARATKDGAVTEGWITLSGSKGTAFLEKTVKPVVKAPAAA